MTDALALARPAEVDWEALRFDDCEAAVGQAWRGYQTRTVVDGWGSRPGAAAVTERDVQARRLAAVPVPDWDGSHVGMAAPEVGGRLPGDLAARLRELLALNSDR